MTANQNDRYFANKKVKHFRTTSATQLINSNNHLDSKDNTYLLNDTIDQSVIIIEYSLFSSGSMYTYICKQ